MEGNKKYESIMASGRELFWKYGFRRVTVEEICAAAGVAKMTFYKFFPNKIELAKSVFDRVILESHKSFKELMESDISPGEKIHRMFLLKAQGSNDVSKEFMADFYIEPDGDLKEYVEKRTKEAWVSVIQDFKNAQQAGIFNNDFKPEMLFAVAYKFIDLMQDERLMNLYASPQEFILEVTNFILHGIAPHK